MLLVSSITSFFDSIRNLYLSLPEVDKLIVYIILILVFILIILLIILFEQRNINKRIVNKKISVNNSTEVLDLYGNDIDEDNEKTRNLKEITDKIQAAIDGRTIDLTKFEQDQEETSIISYDELMKSVGKKIEPATEEFSLPKLVRKIEKEEEIERVEPYINNGRDSENKFKSSVFISPVFGVQGETRPTIKNDEPAIEKLEESYISKTYNEEETFLNNLRNFRKNLE